KGHDNVKFADDDSAHPGNAKGEDKDISAQSSDVSEDQFKIRLDDHHASADPKIDDIAKAHDNGKLAADDRDHPCHAKGYPGKASVPAQNNGKSWPALADHARRASDLKDHDNVKYADDDSAHPGNAKGEDKDISAQSGDVSEDQFKTRLDDHHASADPKIDDTAKGDDNFKLARSEERRAGKESGPGQ